MIRYYLCVVLLGLLTVALFQEARVAGQGTSPNFRIDESFIGPGGNLESSSSNYQFETGQQAVGSTGVTQGESTTYATQGGSKTASEPRLACIVNTGAVNFGALSTTVPITGTASFSVLNYTSYGYMVSIVGSPPSNGSHTLDDMNANATSAVGTEQFGINLVRNADFFGSGLHLGADPVQVPDASFSSGAAAANYGTGGSFRYNTGETIAEAGQSSGQTDFTISYLVNVSNTTAPGEYTGTQTIVCTERLANPTEAAKEESRLLIERVGSLTELPNEEPTIATVSDVNKLQDQPFFKDAQNGDKVLIFTQAKKAILYRPSSQKIITIAPVNLGEAEKNEQSKATETDDKAADAEKPAEQPAE